MKTILVVITNEQKEIKIPSGIRLLIRRCCHATLQEVHLASKLTEISVRLVSSEEIQRINREHRNIDRETDVLSFPQYTQEELRNIEASEQPIPIGDIVISVPKAVQQAEEYGHTLQREVGFLTVHAMLHLLGYHHESGGIEAVYMREKEENVLRKLGIPRGASYVFEDAH